MYDGKDYFTIYDFVKAHYNFADPEWDGEPLEAESCKVCNNQPCSCTKEPCEQCGFNPCNCPKVCAECNLEPCECEEEISEPEPCSDCGMQPCECAREEKIVIELSDGKVRQIKHVSSAMYWSPDGKPITAKEFIERMFDDLPRFFKDEDQLRAIWSDPTTREKLLEDLAEAGYDDEKLESMKDLIDAKDSDVYDVLAYVAYTTETRTRSERAERAQPLIKKAFTNYKQHEFIDFILDKYVAEGVKELAATKMRSLIELKYNTISDAASELGPPTVIRETFIGFQQYLYSG